jgi:hypothetical protein
MQARDKVAKLIAKVKNMLEQDGYWDPRAVIARGNMIYRHGELPELLKHSLSSMFSLATGPGVAGTEELKLLKSLIYNRLRISVESETMFAFDMVQKWERIEGRTLQEVKDFVAALELDCIYASYAEDEWIV